MREELQALFGCLFAALPLGQPSEGRPAPEPEPACRGLREELEAEGVQPPRPLVAVRPTDSLAAVVRTLFDRGCSMAPVLSAGSAGARAGRALGDSQALVFLLWNVPFLTAVQLPPTAAPASWSSSRRIPVLTVFAGGSGSASAAPQPPQPPPGGAPPSPSASAALGDCPEGDVLHTATIAGVLACLMRHFRASLASLPLLAQPLSALPIGTWSPTSSLAAGIATEEAQQQVR